MPHHPFLDIPELVNLEAGRGLVRIPMEQDVPFTRRVRALVDTAEFQRLGHITQLGLVSRVYPGATHTRFEHALGVFHNALRYLWQLGKDERFCRLVDRHAAELLMAAALLHDLGHWPFCHPIEDMALPELPPHEEFAAEFLAPGRELAQVLRDEWSIEPAEVLAVLAPGAAHSLVPAADGEKERQREEGKEGQRDGETEGQRDDGVDVPHSVPPSLRPSVSPSPSALAFSPAIKLLRSILSGPIDIDKMDYLDRDSLHAGVPYGRNFDRNRLIQSLLVNEAGDGLAISSKGKTAAELMVFARYVMFSEVYWHHAVRSATCMFARAFYGLHRDLDLRAFFQKSEAETIAELRHAARGTDCERLLEGVFGLKRDLYKRVAEFTLYQGPDLYRQLAGRPFEDLVRCAANMAERLGKRLSLDIAPTDLLIDAPPPHREVELNVEIYFPKESVYRPLAQVSPVIAALARTQFDDYVKRVRLFAHPRCAQAVAALPEFSEMLQAAVAEIPDQGADAPRSP